MILRQLVSKRYFHLSIRLLQDGPKDFPSTVSNVTSSSTTLITPSTVTLDKQSIEESDNVETSEIQQFSNFNNKLGRGKKLSPKKQNIVILDAKQSRLIRKVPKYFQNVSKKNHVHPLKAAAVNDAGSASNQNMNLEEELRRLSTFMVKPGEVQILKSIETIKPKNAEISKKRYEQVKNELANGFTVAQLKEYIRASKLQIHFSRKTKKAELINRLLVDGWNLKISENINPEEDLVIERTFHLTKKQLFLILAHNSIPNWIRANVKIVVIPEDLEIVVYAAQSHIQYIEIALETLLKNVESDTIDLSTVDQILKKSNQTLPLDEIQKLSGVFFEVSINDEAHDESYVMTHNYVMTSLGKKKFSTALRLIVWSLNYNQHFVNTDMHVDFENTRFEYFSTAVSDNILPWNERAKNWFHLKEPRSVDYSSKPLAADDLDLGKIHSEINSISPDPERSQLGVTLATFGDLLYDSSNMETKDKFVLNTEVPYAHEKILSLPLDLPEGEELDHDTDYHSYHIQMKFVPSPFTEDQIMLYPPVEFWFEIDEYDKVNKSSLQAFIALKEQHSIVSLPTKTTDLKFIKSVTEELVPPFSGSDAWLNDQPGIKEFVSRSRLDYDRASSIYVPDSVMINLPNFDKPVKYNYVSMSYRTHLALKFNKRSLQYSIVEGGSLGGRTTEILMIGDPVNDMNKQEFKEFAQDSLQFIESLQ
ncbi:hypothetical protein WICMUC_003059 [Wickerhamomyces mucosus]|uniref:Uncharacterized protein n=1 Tax=Wickerhamomyces mucosus TaxID=1378264 RepID=A0A9P8TDZ4_9ASCO|nr:hypothetical protein WICMUC_003059 [Wickerhamomyces mucosus]